MRPQRQRKPNKRFTDGFLDIDDAEVRQQAGLTPQESQDDDADTAPADAAWQQQEGAEFGADAPPPTAALALAQHEPDTPEPAAPPAAVASAAAAPTTGQQQPANMQQGQLSGDGAFASDDATTTANISAPTRPFLSQQLWQLGMMGLQQAQDVFSAMTAPTAAAAAAGAQAPDPVTEMYEAARQQHLQQAETDWAAAAAAAGAGATQVAPITMGYQHVLPQLPQLLLPQQQPAPQPAAAAADAAAPAPNPNARMCASKARDRYRLTDRDLDELGDVVYRKNPHYASAAPMRLYLVRELEELAVRKAARKAYEAETKEARAAERAAEARARKAAAAAEAAEAARRFAGSAPALKEQRYGSVSLPETVLESIMGCLVDSLEPGGLRGPSAVCRDLAAAALVCWDFYHASKPAFVRLSEAVSDPSGSNGWRGSGSGINSLPAGQAWAFWDDVIQRPTTLKLPQLKEAAKALGLQVSGTKPQLVLRVLAAFGLSAPTAAPARLLRAVLLERTPGQLIWDGPNAAATARQIVNAVAWLPRGADPGAGALAASQYKGAAVMRAAITAAGFDSVEALRAAGNALQAEYMAQQQAARAALAAQAGQRRAEQQRFAPLRLLPGLRRHGGLCACGNNAAAACSKHCCGCCCPTKAGSCARHGVDDSDNSNNSDNGDDSNSESDMDSGNDNDGWVAAW